MDNNRNNNYKDDSFDYTIELSQEAIETVRQLNERVL